MIRKPPAGWDKPRAPVVTAQRTLKVARAGLEAGIAAGRSLVFLVRAALFGFFALIWGVAGLLSAHAFHNGLATLGVGGAAIFMGWLAKRNFTQAFARASRK